MKHIIYATAISGILCLGLSLRAQEPAPENPGAVRTQQSTAQVTYADVQDPRLEPRQIRVVAQGVPGEPGQDDALRAKAELDRAKAELDRARSKLEHEAAFSYSIAGSPRAERSLVIRTTEADPKTLAAAEEDLNIMGRILEKAASHGSDEERQQAMGIRLFTKGGPLGAKNLQIEGYGAIFMLHVDFPLVGPTTKPEEGAGTEPSNSTWDEAKRELYGQPPGGERDPFAASNPKEDYDPKRVEKLKDSLLDALKNAANMHSLKSDESVTVVVTSGGDGSVGRAFGYQQKLMSLNRAGAVSGMSGGGGWGGGGGGFSSTPPGGGEAVTVGKHFQKTDGTGSSTMTIRAKKSDIDSFANGKLTLEEFRNQAKVLVY
ncbi:MAG: hypothetical protein JWQ04_1259 [Pedosphaera sp.]|nr:hypothetical protein [Pedosphaera sp.]